LTRRTVIVVGSVHARLTDGETMAKDPKRVKAGKKARRKATAGVRKAGRASAAKRRKK